MNSIAITAYNRPEYLRQVVASINACPECGLFEAFACVEAGEWFNQNALELASLKMPVHVETTHGNKGALAARRSLDWAFASGSEFNLGLDDDCPISPDALRLALWFKESVEFFDLLELFGRNRNPSADPSELEAHPTFNAWGWACSPDCYELFIRQAFDDKEEKLWDLAAHKVMLKHGMGVCGVKSRSSTDRLLG